MRQREVIAVGFLTCRSIASYLLFVFFLIAPLPSQASCSDTDKKCAEEAQRSHVVNRIDFWQAALSLPLARRIGSAPVELLDYVRLDNIANGFPERPGPALAGPDFQRDLEAAIAEMPGPTD